MAQRAGRVSRDVAALIGGKRKRYIVNDDVDLLGEVVDGRDVIEVGVDRAERDLRARCEIVHNLDHRGPFLAAIDPAVSELLRFA